MLIDAIDESGRGTAISSTELSIAVDLLSSWQWLSSRPNNISGEFIAAYSHIYYSCIYTCYDVRSVAN